MGFEIAVRNCGSRWEVYARPGVYGPLPLNAPRTLHTTHHAHHIPRTTRVTHEGATFPVFLTLMSSKLVGLKLRVSLRQTKHPGPMEQSKSSFCSWWHERNHWLGTVSDICVDHFSTSQPIKNCGRRLAEKPILLIRRPPRSYYKHTYMLTDTIQAHGPIRSTVSDHNSSLPIRMLQVSKRRYGTKRDPKFTSPTATLGRHETHACDVC